MRGHYDRKKCGTYASQNKVFQRVLRPVYKRVCGRVVRMEQPRFDKTEPVVPGFEYDDLVYMDYDLSTQKADTNG